MLISRKALFIRGVGISYIALIANIAYSLFSIPLALTYLGKENFGLWAVILQIVGYLQLLDVGISSGISRIIIDEKDNRSSGVYGSLLLTGAITQTIIGMCVVASGWIVGDYAASWFKIPCALLEDFTLLLGLQATVAGFGMAFRFVGTPLFAFQRSDLVGIQTIGLFVVYLLTVWGGLHLGLGLYSMVLSMACGLIWTIFVYTLFNIKLGFFPRGSEWGQPSWAKFRAIFSYSKDLFFMNVGIQLLSGTPIFVISRVFGLDAAAAWTVCSKPFQIIYQIVNKPYDLSFPALTEMYVRNEHKTLRNRTEQIFRFTSVFAALAFASAAILSPSFVYIWTENRIQWPLENYFALAFMFFVLSVTRIANLFVIISKQLRFLKYAYFCDGVLYVLLALLLSEHLTIWLLPLIATATHLIMTTPAGLRYFYRDLNIGSADLVQWLLPSFMCALIMTVVAFIAVQLQTRSICFGTQYAFIVQLVLLSLISAPLLWYFGLPPAARLNSRNALRSIYK